MSSGNVCNISIVLRVYNSIELLLKTIKSIQYQETRNFEVIFVNDDSDDSIKECLYQQLICLNSNGIQGAIIDNKVNYGSRGLYGTLMNIGISESKGDYIMVLDSDDLLLVNGITKIQNLIDQNPAIDVLCNNMQILEDKKLTNYLYSDIHPFHWYSFDKQYLFLALLLQNFICHPGTVIKRKTLDSIGGYQSRFSCDHSLWLEMALQRKIFGFNLDPIGIYRFHQNGSSTGLAVDNNVYKEILDIQKQYLPYLPLYLKNMNIKEKELNYIYQNSSWDILKQPFEKYLTK